MLCFRGDSGSYCDMLLSFVLLVGECLKQCYGEVSAVGEDASVVATEMSRLFVLLEESEADGR